MEGLFYRESPIIYYFIGLCLYAGVILPSMFVAQKLTEHHIAVRIVIAAIFLVAMDGILCYALGSVGIPIWNQIIVVPALNYAFSLGIHFWR
jgi:hypothetical protein